MNTVAAFRRSTLPTVAPVRTRYGVAGDVTLNTNDLLAAVAFVLSARAAGQCVRLVDNLYSREVTRGEVRAAYAARRGDCDLGRFAARGGW
jgi:hypothetical protein